LTAVYYSTDLILVGYLRGNRDAGLYAAASKLPLSVIAVAALWFTVAMPETARLSSSGLRDRIQQQTRVTATTAMVVGLPFVVLGPLFATDIATIVFGRRFTDAGAPLAILSASVAISLVQIVVTSVVIGAGRERPYVRAMSFGAGANVLLNLALIPTLGIVGAALATVVAETIVLIAGFRQLRHIIDHFDVKRQSVVEAGAVTIVAAAAALIARHELGFAAAVVSASAVYAGVISVCTLRNRGWLSAWLGNAPS
jgi:O-antigen/teichoic acid export membrane protein